MNYFFDCESERFCNVTGADATCAHFYAPDSPLTDCLDFLKIRMPCSAGLIVCMADIVSEAGTFSADFTCS